MPNGLLLGLARLAALRPLAMRPATPSNPDHRIILDQSPPQSLGFSPAKHLLQIGQQHHGKAICAARHQSADNLADVVLGNSLYWTRADERQYIACKYSPQFLSLVLSLSSRDPRLEQVTNRPACRPLSLQAQGFRTIGCSSCTW